jgi:[ribosomal protein S5]-alanine N-acetyltransferase
MPDSNVSVCGSVIRTHASAASSGALSGGLPAHGMISFMPSLTGPVVPAGRIRSLRQPSLQATDLVIRPWHLGDAAAVLTAYQDPAIQHWHVRPMDDLADASAWISSRRRQWQDESGADWAVTASAAVTGRVAIKRLDLWDGIGELAYWVTPAARGHHVAARAVTAVSAWAFDVLGLHRLELIHATGNPASCRVATRAGFHPEGTMRQHARHADGWHDMHLHARLRVTS